MGFLLAGLLQGAGKAVTDISASKAAQRREDALISLRRQYQKEDDETENTRAIAKEGRDATLKVGLLSLANEYQLKQGETEEARDRRMKVLESDLAAGREAKKYKYDSALVQWRADLDKRNDAASKSLAAEIDADKVKEIRAAADGSSIIFYNDDRPPKVLKDVKLRASGTDDATEGGGDVAEEVRRRREAAGKPPVAAKPVAAKQPSRKWTQANGVYMIGTEADAEAFTADPANKNKTFTFNGRRYTVD